jgi:hypothetical protein
MKWLRKLFGRDTSKLRNEAHRENMRRECAANQEAACQLIKSSRGTRSVSKQELPRLRRGEVA